MIQGFAHAALYTDRFDESIEFYKNALEAMELGRFQTDRRGCWLKVGKSVLEVFENDPLPAEGSFRHIALQCDSVDESFRKAVDAGAEPMVYPKNVRLALNVPQELRIAFVKGVNGEQIELCENLL